MSEIATGHPHHIVSAEKLRNTFYWLTGLMLLTIFAARAPLDGPKYFPEMAWAFERYSAFWQITNAVALGIATWKAVMVIRFFMGAQYASSLVKLYAVGGFLGFLLMFTTLFDYFSRPWEPVPGWEAASPTAYPRSMRASTGFGENNGTPSAGQDINSESRAGGREKGE